MGQDRTVKKLNRLPLDSVPAPRRRRAPALTLMISLVPAYDDRSC